MKLQAMMEQGYRLCAWTISANRGERRVVLKLSKKTSRGEKFYVAHSPYRGSAVTGYEFTEPVLLK